MTTYKPGTTAHFGSGGDWGYRERHADGSWYDRNGRRFGTDADATDWYAHITSPRPVVAGEVLAPSKRYVDSDGDVWTCVDGAWNYGSREAGLGVLHPRVINASDTGFWFEIREPRPTEARPTPKTVNSAAFADLWRERAVAARKEADEARAECTRLSDRVDEIVLQRDESRTLTVRHIGRAAAAAVQVDEANERAADARLEAYNERDRANEAETRLSEARAQRDEYREALRRVHEAIRGQ